jgi:hypothetical protein
MGEMKRAQDREADQATGSRYISTLVIASAIIVAIRTVRDDIGRPSPKILAAITDSVAMARSLLEAVIRRYPRAGIAWSQCTRPNRIKAQMQQFDTLNLQKGLF